VLEYWKLQVEQHHASTSSSNSVGPSTGEKHKAPEEDWVIVPYKWKYKPIGEKHIHFRHYADGWDPTYDDGTPVFNVPTHANPDDWWEQYIEEQVKLHEEGVEDYAMVADGIWMCIPPTGCGFFNPLTDNSYLYMYDKD